VRIGVLYEEPLGVGLREDQPKMATIWPIWKAKTTKFMFQMHFRSAFNSPL